MKFIKSNKAVASIEVAILILPFFLLIFCLIEAFLYAYKISVIDYVLDNSAKISATKKDEIKDEFLKTLETNLLKFGINLSNSKIKIEFCTTLDDYLDDSCSEENNEDIALISYELQYKYAPIFLSLRNVFDINEVIIFKALYAKE